MIKAVIFDLDGTLLDTLEGLMDSVNYALERLGYPTRTIEEIRTFVGNGVAKLIERALIDDLKNPDFDKCLALFKENYSKTMMNKTKPYLQIVELLKELKKRDIKIGIVSNKYDKAVKELSEKYFYGLIDCAIGESEDCRPKPSVDGLNKVLECFNLSKETVLYVGDSEVDILTAQNAKIKLVAVSWGFRSVDMLKKNGAQIIINSAFELLQYL